MLSREEVKKIAKLARLELTEPEIEKMQKDLSSILDYFDVLKKADVRKVKERTILAKDFSNSTRKDEVLKRPMSLAENLVEAAPQKKDGYIKVKPIF